MGIVHLRSGQIVFRSCLRLPACRRVLPNYGFAGLAGTIWYLQFSSTPCVRRRWVGTTSPGGLFMWHPSSSSLRSGVLFFVNSAVPAPEPKAWLQRAWSCCLLPLLLSAMKALRKHSRQELATDAGSNHKKLASMLTLSLLTTMSRSTTHNLLDLGKHSISICCWERRLVAGPDSKMRYLPHPGRGSSLISGLSWSEMLRRSKLGSRGMRGAKGLVAGPTALMAVTKWRGNKRREGAHFTWWKCQDDREPVSAVLTAYQPQITYPLLLGAHRCESLRQLR